MKERAKRSPIWKIDKKELKSIVEKSTSISEVLLHFNLANKGGNYKTLKSRLDRDKINYNHIPQGLNHNKGNRRGGVQSLKDEEVFKTESTYSRHSLKKRIIKNNFIPYKCQICNLHPLWMEKELILILDHINGIFNDNRLENLRFLCPNCNSQTSTFAGRNKTYH